MPAARLHPHALALRAALAALAAGSLLAGSVSSVRAACPESNGTTVRGLIGAGRYAAAESTAWLAVETAERAVPSDSIRLAATLEEAAGAMIANGRAHDPRAHASIRRAVGICERHAVEAGPLQGRCLLTLGRLLAEENRFAEAIATLGRARGIAGMTDPGEEPDSIRVRFELGTALLDSGQGARGWALIDSARALRLLALPPDHPAFLLDMPARADRLWNEGHLDRAIAISDSGLALADHCWGPMHPGRVRILRRKASSLRWLGRYAEAESVYDEAIRIDEAALRPDHPDLAFTRLVAASNLLRLSEYDRCESYFALAMPVTRDAWGAVSIEYANALTTEAEYRTHIGDTARARTLLEEALSIHRKLGSTGVPLGVALQSLGSVLLWYGWPQEGRKCFEEADSIFERTYPPDHIEVAVSKLYVANALHVTRDLDRAEATAKEALAIFRHVQGPRSGPVGDCLKRLGEIETTRGNLTGAIRYFREALSALDGVGGDARFRASNALVQLGTAHQMAGMLDEAERDREASLRAIEAAYGRWHPQTFGVRHMLAMVYEERGKRAEAFRIATEVLDRQVPLMRRALWQLPERESLTFVRGLPGLVATIVALARDGGDAIPGGRARALDAVVRSRGLVLDETARRLQALRQANTPELKDLQLEFATASRRLASLELSGAPASSQDSLRRRASIVDARRERDSVERALGAKDPAWSALASGEDVGLAEVGRAIPPGSVLVSYVAVDRTSFLDSRASFRKLPGNEAMPEPPFGAPAYAAFVLSAGDSVPSIVPLGPAEAMEDLVDTWLREAGTAPPADAFRRRAAERRCREAGIRLRRAAWDPVRERIAAADRIFIVPDGALCAVSFAALPGDTREFLAEGPSAFHYLSTEREITQRPAVPGVGLIALGGADFDATPGGGSPARRAWNPSAPGSFYRGPHSTCPVFRTVKFGPIAGSLLEVDDVGSLWKSAGPASPARDVLVLHGGAASEEAFKAMAPGKRVVHLATHGFVLDGGCASSEDARGFGATAPSPSSASTKRPRATAAVPPQPPSPAVSSSLRLSGLALAGANRRDTVRPDEEDGILTAEEISAMDLSGVEWVVVSACESGRGTVRNGEGVVGLRRSFQLAGARTTIMSLWSVPDRATRDWMGSLYRARLLQGLDTAESVREACRHMLAARRAAGRSTHPFYWGAFVAAGDWR